MCFAVGEDSPYVFSVPSIMGPKGRQKLFGSKNFEAFPLLFVELQCETSAPSCVDSRQLTG